VNPWSTCTDPTGIGFIFFRDRSAHALIKGEAEKRPWVDQLTTASYFEINFLTTAPGCNGPAAMGFTNTKKGLTGGIVTSWKT